LKKINSLFSENNGKISFTRVIGTVLVLFYLVSATYILIKEHKISDIPTNLMILIAALYGLNKLSTMLNKNNANQI